MATQRGAELANSQSFLKELCPLPGVPEAEPTQADESKNTYVFETAVNLNNGDGTSSTGRVDRCVSTLECPCPRDPVLSVPAWLEPRLPIRPSAYAPPKTRPRSTRDRFETKKEGPGAHHSRSFSLLMLWQFSAREN